MKRFLSLLLLALAPAAFAAPGWTRTALTAVPSDLVTTRANLASLPQTTIAMSDNTPDPEEPGPWSTPMANLANGVFDVNTSHADEGSVYPIASNATATFTFSGPARVDEVKIYSSWRDAGRIDVGVVSVAVCDGNGTWTALSGSALPYVETTDGSVLGFRLAFADSSGAPLAQNATGVRIAFGDMDNGWAGIAEIEILGSAGTGTWTKTALQQQAAELVSPADGNLARSVRTTFAVSNNSPANNDKAWQSPAELIVNGIFDTVTSASDEGHLYPFRTGSSVTFSFGAPARVDEVRVYSCWRDNGRVDVGVASVDVCDGEGNWTTLAGSALPFSDGGTSVGWRLVFADGSGAPLAASATAVRVVFGTMDNDWVGIAEMEVLGAYAGTHTVTFCDENGDPLPGVAPQTVATGTAATEPDPSLIPEKEHLVFVGWDVDIFAVFEDLFPRPVYGTEIQYSRNGAWVRTPLSVQAADLAPASSNLVRRPTTSMTLDGAQQQAAAAPNLMLNGVFEGHFDTSKEDIDVYVMRSGVKVTFDFVGEARVDAVRIFSTWIDTGRNDIAVNSVSVRDAVGIWTTLEGSALSFVNTSGIALQSVFSDPSGGPLARGATAIEIDFGTMENTYVGMAEIEVIGELTGVYTVTFCDENGDPLPGVEVQTVEAGHAATAPDPAVVPPKEGFVFTGWSESLDAVLSNLRPRPVYAAPGAVLVSSGPFRTGSPIPFGLNVLAESGAVAADGAVAVSATRDPGYNGENRDPAVLVDGRFVFANGEGDVAAIETGSQFVYTLPSPRDVDSVGFYTFWSDGGRDGFSFSSIQWREEGDPNWKTVSFDEVRYGLGDNFSQGSYFISVSRAGGPLLTNAVAVKIPFLTMDNSCTGIGEIQALRSAVASPRAAWSGRTWGGAPRRSAGGNLLRRESGTSCSFVRNGAAPDAAALAALADGIVSESSTAVCPVASDAIFEAVFDAPERVGRIEFWTKSDGAHDGLAVNEILFRHAGSDAFVPNDDMEPFRVGTFEADGDDTSGGRLHVVVEPASGKYLAEAVTGVRIWFGRADNDRTDLQELEIFPGGDSATMLIVR